MNAKPFTQVELDRAGDNIHQLVPLPLRHPKTSCSPSEYQLSISTAIPRTISRLTRLRLETITLADPGARRKSIFTPKLWPY